MRLQADRPKLSLIQTRSLGLRSSTTVHRIGHTWSVSLESHNPCCGKALEHADSFLFWCWGGIRPRNRVMPESGIPEFDSGRINSLDMPSPGLLGLEP